MNLKSYLNEKRKTFESALYSSISDPSIPELMRKSMQYSLEAGGKRLRPILVFAGAEAVGGDASKVMNVAVALEMIHTFSLIHDDLPSMDNDDLRRGKPTSHKVFGEANAILAGDALLAEAFYVLSETKCDDPKLLVSVIKDVADATGARGMTGGQVIDMESTGKKINEADLIRLQKYKTGALLKVSVTSGAKLCNAKASEIAALDKYGDAIGLAFQIADDVLDIEGDEATLGKDIGSDEEKGKATFPSIIGLEASKKRAASLIDESISLLHTFGERAEPLREIAKYIIERNK